MNPVSSVPPARTGPRLADYIIKAKAIYLMAENHKVYRAIAIRDEWIVAVSENPDGLDGLVSAATLVLDDPALTLLPAFDDSHNHFILAAESIRFVQVDQATRDHIGLIQSSVRLMIC